MKKKLVFLLIVFLICPLEAKKFTAQESVAYARQYFVDTISNRIKESLYFLPNKEVNIKELLIGLINNEKKGILFAQFILSDKDVAEALKAARERGVPVMGIVDNGCLSYKNEQITSLKRKGVKVAVYKKPYSIMHLKCFLFGRNFLDKEVLWNGSANTTFSAYARNQEYVHVTQNKLFCNEFKNKFNTLYREIATQKSREKQLIKNNPFHDLLKFGKESHVDLYRMLIRIVK